MRLASQKRAHKNNVPFDERQPASGFVEGRPRPSSQGQQMLFSLQQKLEYLYDFEFNVPIGCDRAYDNKSGRELGIAWITPDTSHREASFAVEIDGIQNALPSILNDDIERDELLAPEGWAAPNDDTASGCLTQKIRNVARGLGLLVQACMCLK